MDNNSWFNDEWGGVKEVYNRSFNKTLNRKDLVERREKLKTSLDLEPKLEGLTDNSERYRIVDEYLTNKENEKIQPKDGRSLKQKQYKYTPYNGVKTPYLDENKERYKKPLKDKLNESLFAPLKEGYNKFLKKVSSELPNSVRDMLTASSLGVQTKQTTLGRVGNAIGSSEVTGYNPISKSNINIDYLSNKIDNDTRLNINESDNKAVKFFKNSYNSFYESQGKRNLEQWKKMHIEETSKSVRRLGDNINPFDSGENLDYVRHNLKDASGRPLIQGPPTRSALAGNESLKEIRARDSRQLVEVEKRIADSKNNIKTFFNPIDTEELKMLQIAQSELTERVRRIDGNYGASRINTEELRIPKSVAESFKDLHDRRVDLNTRIQGLMGSNSIYDQTSRGLLNNEYTTVNRQLAIRDSSEFTNFKPIMSESLGSPITKDSYKPTFGTSGYGLGFMNSMTASRTEHAARALHYLNPLGAGGASAGQALMESFGIMNKAQRMQAAQARGFSKVTHNAVPLVASGLVLSGMYNKDDAGQIFEDLFSMGTSLHGWRTGSAIGGAIGSKASLTRLLGLGIGGLTGMAAGYAIGSAVVGGIRDVTSNESQIRKFAKNVSTKEAIVSQVGTQQSLTARQASLQKLAKSGLNDRGVLLGNESLVLAGVM